MNKPVTIKIFLPDGDPTGIKEAEIINWTGKAVVIPRKIIKNIDEDLEISGELESQGIYFLISQDELEVDSVYIGKSSNLVKRLRRHHYKKDDDFWNKAVCFFSKDSSLTETNTGYLEHKIIKIISKNSRAELQNNNNPQQTPIQRTDIANAENYLENVKLLLPALGYNYLKEASQETGQVYYCEAPNNNVRAKGKLTNEGFVVLKGSLVNKKEAESFSQDGTKRLRKQLIQNDILKDNGKSYKLTKEQLFSSPSAAAGFVLGRNANGWTEWQTEDGRTLDEIERQED